jgi:CRP/FNR family transcriptional regulator
MSSTVKYWYLKNYSLCSELSSEEVHELNDISRFVRVKKGEKLVLANGSQKKIFFLLNGKIKVVDTCSGCDKTKNIITTGGVLGDTSIFSEVDSSEEGEILSAEAILLAFDLREFEKMMVRIPKLALAFTKYQSQKLRDLEWRYSNLAVKDVKGRLIDFLINWAAKEGQQTDDGWTIRNYLTHMEIANLIDSSRQTVTSTINMLKKQGSINFGRQRIVIRDIENLAA